MRVLNQCKDSNPSCEFTLDNEFIHIEFSGDGKLHACGPEMKPDTVLLVEVFPKAPLTLKSFGVNQRRYKTIDLSRSVKGFVDEENGLVIKAEGGRIIQLDYVAARVDRDLCAAYYKNLVAFIQTRFDSHVPVIYLSCPSAPVRAGEKMTVSADIAGNPKITFLWTLTAGAIVSGQGTRRIEIDTTGLEGKTVLATAKLGRVQSSCQVQISNAIFTK